MAFKMSSHLSLVFFIVLIVLQYTFSDNNADSSSSNLHHIVSAESSRPQSDLLLELQKPEIEHLDKSAASTAQTEIELTFDKLYLQGIQAYNQEQWYLCANNLEQAITDYRFYKQVLSNCRFDCSKGVRVSKLANISSSIYDFSHFAKLLRDADCFRRCKDESLTTLPRLTEQLENTFEKRAPYQYLQFCYFKLDRLTQAASAAYTYYLVNPDDLVTKQNIVYYRDKAMVPTTDFVDLELVPYKEHYIKAMIAYNEQNWRSAIVEIESSLKLYFQEHERCLVNCGAKVKMSGGEFSTKIANMFIHILFCKLNCEETLSTIYTHPINHFLQDMYHYLQFAYYQEGNLEKAAEATASFLVLNSSHAVMKENKDLLKEKLKYTDKDFVPQQNVVDYALLRKEMYGLMDFINKNYRWPNDNMIDEDSDEGTEKSNQDTDVTEDWMTKYEKLGTHIIAKSVDLHREGRFVVDGMLKDEQCEELLSLTRDLKAETIGSQKFNFTVAQQRFQENPDEVYEAALRFLFRAIDIVSQYTQRYLDESMELYLKDVSIVCWSYPDDLEEIRGCHIQENGTCVKFDDMYDDLSSDAYTTVTYLNTADGDFQFLNENDNVESSFGVMCGRTVGFYTRDRHSVKVPGKHGGQRCGLVIRFSNVQGETESGYKNTIALIHRVDELRHANTAKSGINVMKKFEQEGVKIVKNGEELMGKERFVADGLASDEQCNTLRNMVQMIAVVAEEYTHKSAKDIFVSSHTEHELYQGITIYRAAKLTHQRMISTIGLRTFLELSENSRLLVEKYFNLTKPLYFDYTHLVCRIAIDDSKINRQDLSHPVHADNCNLQPDGSCTKDFPAFIHRDYSAILYLNADFEGGEFFFAHSNKSEQVALRPKCGRLVGFSAGEFHGVRAVRSGQRCALALWFTLDSSYKELAHNHARKTLKWLEDEQRAEELAVHEEL